MQILSVTFYIFIHHWSIAEQSITLTSSRLSISTTSGLKNIQGISMDTSMFFLLSSSAAGSTPKTSAHSFSLIVLNVFIIFVFSVAKLQIIIGIRKPFPKFFRETSDVFHSFKENIQSVSRLTSCKNYKNYKNYRRLKYYDYQRVTR